MSMNEWIKIEDRKPPQDCYVLVARFDGRPNVNMFFLQIASRIGDSWIDDHDGELIPPKYGAVTHWMPLPETPK